MWWDWIQITVVDSVLLSILVTAFLYLVGSGILRLIALARNVDVFGSFDFLQRAAFKIFFGLAFIVLATVILSFANIPFIVPCSVVILVSVVGLLLKRRFADFSFFRRKQLSVTLLAAIVVIFVTVVFSSMLISGLNASTNDDGAFHTLIVRILLDNPNVLLTRDTQPLANFFLVYPSGTHVMAGFLVTVFGVSIQKVVTLATAILPALIALSFYCLLKCLFKNSVLSILGLLISAFFIVGLSWAPIGWAGLPLLLSLFLAITSMGLIFSFLESGLTWIKVFLIGMAFFLVSQTYPVALLIVSLWFLTLLGAKLIRRALNGEHVKPATFVSGARARFSLFFAFLVPLFFSLPYYVQSLLSHGAAGVSFNELSPVYVPLIEFVSQKTRFNWLIDFPALSTFFSAYGSLLALAPLCIIILILLFVPAVSERVSGFFPKELRWRLLLMYVFFLILMSYLTVTLYFEITFLTTLFSPERIWSYFVIPGVVFTSIILFFGFALSRLALMRLFKDNRQKRKIVGGFFLGAIILVSGFLIWPAISEQNAQYQSIGRSIAKYETVGAADLSLMRWIIDNIPPSSNILVSGADSGQFVTAVTGHPTVSMYSFLANYTDLMAFLSFNASNTDAVPFLLEYNVSYVYVGSIQTHYEPANPAYGNFNSAQFLSTSYFTLIKQSGDAWLFQFDATKAQAVTVA